MAANPNGINMLDVKKSNRSSIIKLIHATNGISRKEIAAALSLTPAAITLITNDLLQEGLILETFPTQAARRRGRKEVILELNRSCYASIGIYISHHKFDVICIDLQNEILFETTVYIDDCRKESQAILEKIAGILRQSLTNYDVCRKHTLLGIGICVHGIVDTERGISITSYGIWEDNTDATSYLELEFQVPVCLTNNICALAHGEAFLSNKNTPSDMLFIKYGPGVGAARIISNRSFRLSDYKAIELGHLIMEANGAPCVCGNQGCLETMIGYDAIEQSIRHLITPAAAPALYRLLNGNPGNINMEYILQAFEAGDTVAQMVMGRAVHYLALAVKNAICLLDPETVVLYGELFEHQSLRDALGTELLHYSLSTPVTFSSFNAKLNALGPATTAITYFFDNGGDNSGRPGHFGR